MSRGKLKKMGVPILLIGKSGSGKSASLRNFPECGVINVLGKPLPFPNAPKTYVTDDYNAVINKISTTKAKSVIIDDAGYLITNQFMRGHSVNGGGINKFDFYNILADWFWRLIEHVIRNTPPDMIVYIVMHEDKNDAGEIIPRVTGGKMLNEKVCIEGMMTIVLHSTYDNGKYMFRVKTDGTDIAKTPMGMFDTPEIENDLKLVDDRIREYYHLNQNTEEAKE